MRASTPGALSSSTTPPTTTWAGPRSAWTCALYMGFSLYAIMQTYKDEGDDYARAEAMITACDVAGVAYIGTIVFMMLFHLSSIQPTTFELRGELSRQTAKHSAAVDREIRATVDYLQGGRHAGHAQHLRHLLDPG